MDVIWNFYNKSNKFWNRSVCLDLAYFILRLFCLKLDVCSEKFAWTLRCLGLGLACSSRVVVCLTAVTAHLVSEWEKFQLWIEPPRGKIPTTELALYFLPSGGTSHQGATKLELWEVQNPCIRFRSPRGENPVTENSVYVERPSETHRLIFINTFTRGHILSSNVYTRFSEWRHILATVNRSSTPEWGETHSRDRQAEIVRMHKQTHNEASIKCKYRQNQFYELILMDSCD